MLPSMLLDTAVSASAQFGSMLQWQHCTIPANARPYRLVIPPGVRFLSLLIRILPAHTSMVNYFQKTHFSLQGS